MSLKIILSKLSDREKFILAVATVILAASFIVTATIQIQEHSVLVPISGGLYREGVVGQPVAINPVVSSNPVDKDLSALVWSPVTDIASNIETKKDGRIYTVKIEEGLLWSNDKPLTADDIVFTVKTIQNPNSKSPLYSNWEGVAVERLSELQVQFTLPNEYAFFMENIKRLPVIPKHIFENIPPENFHLSTYNLEPVGNGPYKFESFSKRRDGFISEYRLTVNKNYPKEKPFIKTFVVKFFENESDAVRAFKFRQIDGFGTLVPLPPSTKFSGAKTRELPMSRYYAVFFNPNLNPLLKDAGFRTALGNAVDPHQIINEVFGGKTATAITSPVLIATGAVRKNQTEVAKTIGRTRSAYGKITLSLIVPKVNFLEKTANLIKEAWLRAGVDEVNLIALPLDEIKKNIIATNNYELLLFGNILENPEDLYPFWHSAERFYPGLNLAAYKNQKADSLIEKIRTSTDPQDRIEYLKALGEIIASENPAVFLYTLPYIYYHTERLNGFDVSREFIASPSDRFEQVATWHLVTARVIKKPQVSTSTLLN